MVVRLQTCIRSVLDRNLGRMSEHSGGGFVVFLSPSSQLWDSTISTRPHHSNFFIIHQSSIATVWCAICYQQRRKKVRQ